MEIVKNNSDTWERLHGSRQMAKEEIHSVAELTALVEAQRKQIEKLEKQLKYSQDKNLALNTLIDVIEEQGIKLRKSE